MNLNLQPKYDQEAVQPMRDELVAVGFHELRTALQVEHIVKNTKGTILIVINSVCGCAAGTARPGVSLALQNDIIPDNLFTVFAGQEKDAVEKVRSFVSEYAPSSPSMVILQDSKPIFFLPRFEIEGFSKEQVADKLIAAFNKYCTRKGPSVPPEQYEKVVQAKACGSKIPTYKD